MNYKLQTIFVFVSTLIASVILCVLFTFLKLLLTLVPILHVCHMTISFFISLIFLQPSFILIASLKRMNLLNAYLSEVLLLTLNRKYFKIIMVTSENHQREMASILSMTCIQIYDVINLFNAVYGFGVNIMVTFSLTKLASPVIIFVLDVYYSVCELGPHIIWIFFTLQRHRCR